MAESRYVDLGPSRDDGAVGLLVVLPGEGYHPDKPLLAVATQLAVDLGWRVRQVWWKVPGGAGDEWAGVELRAAVAGGLEAAGAAGVDGLPVRLLAKSVGSLAAPEAARAAYSSCWLTPLLGRTEVVEGIAASQAGQLLVGGTADRHWDGSVARTAAAAAPRTDTLELPGADHSLAVKGNKNATASAHAEFIRVFGQWLG